MKTTKFFFMAALALMTAACNKDDDLIQQPAEQPAPADEITITTTIGSKDDAATRATVDNGYGGLYSRWAVGEEIAILFKINGVDSKRIAKVKEVTSYDAAVIEFTIPASGVEENAPANLVYPASAANDANTGLKTNAEILSAQDGTLNDALDVRINWGTIQVATPGFTLNSSNFQKQFGIVKFTLNDVAGHTITASQLVIEDKSGITYTITPASPTSEMYVYMDSSGNVKWFTATVGDKPYIAVSSGNPNGFYCKSTVRMATIGNVIATNCRFYSNVAAATDAGTTARAMIAYLGTAPAGGTGDATCRHGLAIALENLTNNSKKGMSWNNSGSNNGGKTAIELCNALNGPDVNLNFWTYGFHWRLPSVDDWKYMIAGCGGGPYTADLSNGMYYDDGSDPSDLRSRVYDAGGDVLGNNWFWTSESAGQDAYEAYAYFYDFNVLQFKVTHQSNNNIYIRPCLAF